MKNIVVLLCILCAFGARAQQRPNFDSLANVLCRTFDETAGWSDSLRIGRTFGKLQELVENRSEQEARDWSAILFLRLQRSCRGFDSTFENQYRNDEEGITIQKDLPGLKNSKACQGIFQDRLFYYLEGNAKVRVHLTSTTWKSLFPDGTYSLLTVKKTGSCEFVITYVTSNNYVISNSLKKGDRFRYKIVQEFPTYLVLISEDLATHKKQLFKLFRYKR